MGSEMSATSVGRRPPSQYVPAFRQPHAQKSRKWRRTFHEPQHTLLVSYDVCRCALHERDVDAVIDRVCRNIVRRGARADNGDLLARVFRRLVALRRLVQDGPRTHPAAPSVLVSAIQHNGETHLTGDLEHVGPATADVDEEDDMVDIEHPVIVAALDRDLPFALVRARRLALGADELGVSPVVDHHRVRVVLEPVSELHGQ
jgi:hypothetical protein